MSRESDDFAKLLLWRGLAREQNARPRKGAKWYHRDGPKPSVGMLLFIFFIGVPFFFLIVVAIVSGQKVQLGPKFYSDRGLSHVGKDEFYLALFEFNKAIELDPKFANAYSDRGVVHTRKGDFDRALADFNKAIELDPKFAPAYYYNRGHVYWSKGDLDRAFADYSKAIELDPGFASAYNSRCWSRAISGRDLPLALADCDESLRLRPNDAATLDSRGLVFLSLNRLDEAIADYDAALKISAKMAHSLYGRGIAKQRKGDQAGAAQDIAAGRAIKADLADEFAKWGVK